MPNNIVVDWLPEDKLGKKFKLEILPHDEYDHVAKLTSIKRPDCGIFIAAFDFGYKHMKKRLEDFFDIIIVKN